MRPGWQPRRLVADAADRRGRSGLAGAAAPAEASVRRQREAAADAGLDGRRSQRRAGRGARGPPGWTRPTRPSARGARWPAGPPTGRRPAPGPCLVAAPSGSWARPVPRATPSVSAAPPVGGHGRLGIRGNHPPCRLLDAVGGRLRRTGCGLRRGRASGAGRLPARAQGAAASVGPASRAPRARRRRRPSGSAAATAHGRAAAGRRVGPPGARRAWRSAAAAGSTSGRGAAARPGRKRPSRLLRLAAGATVAAGSTGATAAPTSGSAGSLGGQSSDRRRRPRAGCRRSWLSGATGLSGRGRPPAVRPRPRPARPPGRRRRRPARRSRRPRRRRRLAPRGRSRSRPARRRSAPRPGLGLRADEGVERARTTDPRAPARRRRSAARPPRPAPRPRRVGLDRRLGGSRGGLAASSPAPGRAPLEVDAAARPSTSGGAWPLPGGDRARRGKVGEGGRQDLAGEVRGAGQALAGRRRSSSWRTCTAGTSCRS